MAEIGPNRTTLLSSPDPLGMSNENLSTCSPTKTSRHPSKSPRKALTDASSKYNVQEFYINTPPAPRPRSSPSKASKQPRQSTSPWRIRLTVQAEQVGKTSKPASPKMPPAKYLTERTTTITVPLKGADNTPPAVKKRARGRPRKSLDSPVKRTGTPKPNAGGRRKTLRDSVEEPNVRKVAPPGREGGRLGKSVQPDLETSETRKIQKTSKIPSADDLGKSELSSKSARTRSRGQRKEITPVKIALDADTDSRDGSADVVRRVPKGSEGNTEAKHGTTSAEPSLLRGPLETSSRRASEISPAHSPLYHQDQDLCKPMIFCEGRPPSIVGDTEGHEPSFDPKDHYREFNSILESEGFSMVSVSSLSSAGNQSAGSVYQDESQHEHTPLAMSSPSLPQAPQIVPAQSSPRHLKETGDGTPKLVRVVRAGIALQGALSPNPRIPVLGSPFQRSEKLSPFPAENIPVPQQGRASTTSRARSPKECLDDLFGGFGAGTRRELKAGLRLGEELAKRQQKALQTPAFSSKVEDDVFLQEAGSESVQLPSSVSTESYSLNRPGSGSQVKYPLLSNNQLPSPARSEVNADDDRMSWKADTPVKADSHRLAPVSQPLHEEQFGSNAPDDSMVRREAEWQQEREAVSRQIELANKSQVIVIGSDDGEEEAQQEDGDAEDTNDSDIWQAEAHSVDHSRETTPEVPTALLQSEVLKPRRSKLPGPWRCNSQVIYSDELEPTEEDLFWQPGQAQANASKKRTGRSAQVQSVLELSTASLLDSSIENTRKAEAQIQSEASRVLLEGASSPTIEDVSRSEKPQVAQDVQKYPGKNHCPDSNQGLEEITTLTSPDGKSFQYISRGLKERKIAIDPQLLHKRIRPPISTQPVQTAVPPPTSWLSRLAGPLWRVIAPATPVLPAATKEDILCSSPYEPLCQLTPWEECHFRALGPLYYASLLYGAHLFPFNPRSPAAIYCGATVTTSLCWSRTITPADCGITDAFMVLLDERGFALGAPGEQWIDEGYVISMCVSLWVGMAMRGEVEIDRSKGEKSGLRKQRDRKWTEKDIAWEDNESEYFERKRREFDGLPSWKNNGL